MSRQGQPDNRLDAVLLQDPHYPGASIRRKPALHGVVRAMKSTSWLRLRPRLCGTKTRFLKLHARSRRARVLRFGNYHSVTFRLLLHVNVGDCAGELETDPHRGSAATQTG